jgi:hypothetical protein
MMVVVNGHLCYMFTLSDAERAAIHTDAGIRAVEVHFVTIIKHIVTDTSTTYV